MPKKNTVDRPAVLINLKEEGWKRRQRETRLMRRAKQMAIHFKQQFRCPNQRAPHSVAQRPRTLRMVVETEVPDSSSLNSFERSTTPINLDQEWETWDRPMTSGRDIEGETKDNEPTIEDKKPSWTLKQLVDYIKLTPDPTKWEAEVSEALSGYDHQNVHTAATHIG